MFAKFSNEAIVSDAMRDLNLSYSFLAEVSGACSVGALHAWLAGTGRLSPAKEEMLVGVCNALREHAQQVSTSTGLEYPLSYAGTTARFWKVLLARERGETKPGWELNRAEANGLKHDGLVG